MICEGKNVEVNKVEVKNVMEQLVFDQLDRVLAATKPACDCEMCRADIVAYALNNLKPKYAATHRGEVISKAAALQNQFYMDVIAVLTRAVEVVGSKPRHSAPGEGK